MHGGCSFATVNAMTDKTYTTLIRIRWAVRATLVLGLAASLAANVLHAPDNPISRGIAAWPPVALLLTVELVSRIPVSSRWLSSVRIAATASIAGIAAWVSYWHMVAVAAKYGEQGVSAFLVPLSVDGLVVVASVSLVELTGRIRTLDAPVPDMAETDHVPVVSASLDTEKTTRTRVSDAALAALQLRREFPDMTQQAIAERVGRSVRQVRRYLGEREGAASA